MPIPQIGSYFQMVKINHGSDNDAFGGLNALHRDIQPGGSGHNSQRTVVLEEFVCNQRPADIVLSNGPVK